jgi:hypothetical protein
MNIRLIYFALWAGIFVTSAISSIAHAGVMDQSVSALPQAECSEVRKGLEDGVPILPGFRQLEYEFAPNVHGIKGRLCRLHAVGSGAHMENTRIRSLADMHAFIEASLEHIGWIETIETERFKDRSQSGKDVFALFKNNAICVTTILISPAPGYIPTPDTKSNKQVHLGALYPYEREWWVAVDCFHL